MIILHIAPIDTTRANGLRFSVPGLASSQNKVKGVKVGLLNIEDSKKLSKLEIQDYKFDLFPEFMTISELPEPFNTPDLVVFHGVYFKKYITLYKKLKSMDIPYVIVPRVSLTFEAQRQKKIKKKIANILIFNQFIKNAVKIHYLTFNEHQLSKSFNKDSFIVSNGIEIPKMYKKTKSNSIKITFIGRYDINHKGLDILIESINQIKEELAKHKTIINLFGTDFRDGKAFLIEKIKSYQLEEVCYVNGAVFNKEKKMVLEDTDIFIAPSRFEGHPMAVVEAMANGIPCILTEGTNMIDVLEKYNAGWVSDLNSKDLARVIITAIKDKEGIINKGKNARKLVKENYSWEMIAEKTLSHYKEILKGSN